jgi:tetratricopeptide (TPR) repeat protein
MLYKRIAAQGSKLLVGLLMVVVLTNDVRGQMHHADGDTLGVVNFPITGKPSSQREFNRAMALLHHMTYPEARESFQRIVASDDGCAMAHWGVAMTLFQPLWPTRPNPRELQRGWEAIQKAVSSGPVTERERLLMDATAAFFREPSAPDYWRRIQAWAEGMGRAYAALPNDDEVRAFYALALLATVPPDQVSSTNNARAAEILLRILKNNPHHPGAMHYLIHANDVPGRERESLEILREYERVAPHNPHALHMPTHIYTRLGDWNASVAGNLKAADAALDFPAGDAGQFVWDEFPHAIEFLIYAYLQIGADDKAAAQLERLHETKRLETTFKTAFHLASTRARYALERKAWNEAAAISPREPNTVDWDRFPWPEAIGWFARGLGSVHLGNSSEAAQAQLHLGTLEAAASKTDEVLFSRNVRVLRLELTAWIEHHKKANESSVKFMTQAAELETSTPKHAVTPAPTVPAHELLGDLLLGHGEAGEALTAYQRSLEINPHRFNSLLGAARAAAALGNKQTAALFYRQLLAVAEPESKRRTLQEARDFLAK